MGKSRGTAMSDAIVYVDTAEVREGALQEVKAAIQELVDFVDANVPRLIAYNVYLSDDGTRMTVVHVHPDSASLEYHMEVAGPVFRQFVEFVTLSSIHVYGEPGEKVLKQLHEKARLLGRRGAVEVEVDALHAGFTRFAYQA
jgi:quinol monooxygenase YgiN